MSMWETQRLQLGYFTDMCLDMLRETNEHLGQNSGYRGWVAQLWPAEFLNKSVRTQPQCCASDLPNTSVFERALYKLCVFAPARPLCLTSLSKAKIIERWWHNGPMMGFQSQGKSESFRTNVPQGHFSHQIYRIFYVLLTINPCIISQINRTRCTILFNIFICFSSVHVSDIHVPIIRRKLLYLYDTGICHSVCVASVLLVGFIQPADQTPHIQSDKYQCRIDTAIYSWWWTHWCPKHV